MFLVRKAKRAEMVRLLADLGVSGETVSGPAFVCRKDFTHPLSGRYQTRAVTPAQQGLLRDGLEAWAARVQAAGALALYSTTWDNAASRALAARLQMVEFGWEMRIG